MTSMQGSSLLIFLVGAMVSPSLPLTHHPMCGSLGRSLALLVFEPMSFKQAPRKTIVFKSLISLLLSLMPLILSTNYNIIYFRQQTVPIMQ